MVWVLSPAPNALTLIKHWSAAGRCFKLEVIVARLRSRLARRAGQTSKVILQHGAAETSSVVDDAKLKDGNDCRSDGFAQIMLEYANDRIG